MTTHNPNAPDPGDQPPPRQADSRQQPDSTPAPAGSDPPHPQAPAEEPAHRPWATRRVPVAVTASLITLAAGALLFEAVWTRTGNNANAWWTTLTDQLAGRPVNDVWILTGAAVAAALGLWLIILAVTPGLRRRLPLRVPADGIRAVLDRKGAALILRDAALRVPGVSAARIRVHRRRVKIRADARFRDTSDVKDDLTEAVQREQRDRLALARPPKPVIRIRRSPT